MSGPPPRIAYEERGPHHAVIWYERPRPAAAPGNNGERRRLPPGPALQVGLAVPSWGRPCGVAEYSRGLLHGLRAAGLACAPLAGEEVAAVARQLHLDLVHFQHEYSLWDPDTLRRETMALLRSGVRTVATVHALAEVPEHNEVLREGFEALVVHSAEMARQACALLRVPPRRVHVIAMGVPAGDLPAREAARARLGLGGEPAIGYLGFFYPQKGIVPLVQAARLLRRTWPGLRCLIMAATAPNPASTRARGEALAALAAAGLAGEAEVLEGYLPEEELVARLAALDVIVLPYAEYRARQLSAAVRLAIAACRPIVVTDVFAFSDLRDEVHRVPSNDPETLAAGVRAVLADPERQAALVAACRRYREHNSWARVGARHLVVYRSL